MSENWLLTELLDTISSLVEDRQAGVIGEETFTERIYQIAGRYERYAGRSKTLMQEDLFGSG